MKNFSKWLFAGALKIGVMVFLFSTIREDMLALWRNHGIDRFWAIMGVFLAIIGMNLGAAVGSRLVLRMRVPKWLRSVIVLICTLVCSYLVKTAMLWLYHRIFDAMGSLITIILGGLITLGLIGGVIELILALLIISKAMKD